MNIEYDYDADETVPPISSFGEIVPSHATTISNLSKHENLNFTIPTLHGLLEPATLPISSLGLSPFTYIMEQNRFPRRLAWKISHPMNCTTQDLLFREESNTSGTLTFTTLSNNANTFEILAIKEHDPLHGYERYTHPNWDGYGAEPITPETLKSARMFLHVMPRTFGYPDIAPGSDGTIGFEWVFNDRPLRKLFIDIGPGDVWHGFWRRASGEYKTLPTSKIGIDTAHELARLFKALNT